MEETQKKETKKFLGMKPTIALAVMFLILAVPILAAVVVHSYNVDVIVGEPLSSSNVDVTLNALAGETETHTIMIDNLANVALDVDVAWTETSNVNGVVYTTSMPQTFTVPSGLGNTFDVTFDIDSGSPTGTFEGSIVIERV